ncbi:MAG: hypothetical protein HC837_17610 [Chloroflexaceae bacterium]|nr:hypothetical protein [Chloroflexaceae bacterium]
MQETMQKLAELKVRLISATDFYTVFDYFYDHISEDEHFMDMSTPTQNDFLQQVLVTCAQSALKQSVIAVSQMMMLYAEDAQFYHGGAWFNYLIANFFYFEDIDAGLMALVIKPAGNETLIARFSIQALDQPKKPSKN